MKHISGKIKYKEPNVGSNWRRQELKKSAKECFKAYRKDVEYFYEVVKQRSLDLNREFSSEKDYLNTTLSHFRQSLTEMNDLYDKCRDISRHHFCLTECQKLSEKFAKNALTVFQLMLVVDRYEQQDEQRVKESPETAIQL
ncbi:unnamed protein product [Medioppia subpectinata]|uniref:Uncharacterized protein n=1 Tax=Medioppia subpectinata TaxID=1979941 RepID=A0A7R9KY03_9ACAR|nr:unnamed protein product [Medioppia subpectinata]CAG2111715.1 unnamed protein product [Medioppia subpectinata]